MPIKLMWFILAIVLMAGCGSTNPNEATSQQNFLQTQTADHRKFDGMWAANYEYPSNTGLSSTTISIPGNTNTAPIIDSNTTSSSFIVISGNEVTFSPMPSAPVNGTISDSGIITIPDLTIDCLDISGHKLVLSSSLTLSSNGTINGQWSIGLPLPNVGYCFAYPIKATFTPSPSPNTPSITILQ